MAERDYLKGSNFGSNKPSSLQYIYDPNERKNWQRRIYGDHIFTEDGELKPRYREEKGSHKIYHLPEVKKGTPDSYEIKDPGMFGKSTWHIKEQKTVTIGGQVYTRQEFEDKYGHLPQVGSDYFDNSWRKQNPTANESHWQGALPGQEVARFASAGDLSGMFGSNRLTPDILKGSGYGKFVDTDTLPEVIAHKQREREAYSAWEKADQYRSSYLGGRSAGTQGEFEEWQRRAASADSAFGRYDSILQQGMDALHSGLNTWGKQHNLSYSGGEWSWINQNVAEFNNGYDTWMSKDNPYTDFNGSYNVALDDREGANWNWIQKTYGSKAGQWYKDHLDEPWENNPNIDGYIPFTETVKMDAENKKLRETPNMENIASNAVIRRRSSNNNVMKIKTGSSSGTLGTGVVV